MSRHFFLQSSRNLVQSAAIFIKFITMLLSENDNHILINRFLELLRESIDRNYFIKSRITAGFESTTCQSSLGGFVGAGCTGIGWTYIGDLNTTNNNQTSYDSPVWTAMDVNQTNFNSQFWSANVTEVCLTSTTFSMQLPVLAPSLRSLFFEKTILNIDASEWLSKLEGIVTPNFTTGCYESGFNVGDADNVQARIGIVSVATDQGCVAGSPQAIGVGIKNAGSPVASLHGVVSAGSIDPADVKVYVRSQYIQQPPI